MSHTQQHSWIGHPGAMVPLPCPSGAERNIGRTVDLSATGSGGRRAYIGRRALRSWKLTLGLLSASEAAAITEVMVGMEPPYVWVDRGAAVTNLLTLEQSMCKAWAGVHNPPIVRGGRKPLTGGGWAASSLTIPTQGPFKIGPVPVVPGQVVTASAWLGCPTGTAQGASIRLQWLDTAGRQVGSLTGPGVAVDGIATLTRAHVTATAPATAAAAAMQVSGAQVLTRPAITWTAGPVDWHVGGGAPTVVIEPTDENTLAAWDDTYLSGMTITLTEVG